MRNAPQSYGASLVACKGSAHTVLPAMLTRPTPTRHRFTYPEGWMAELTWVDGYIPRW